MEKVKVSERALIQRINRKLKSEDQLLKVSRENSRSFSTLGRYFIVDIYRNFVISHDIDIVGLARELGALKEYEDLL